MRLAALWVNRCKQEINLFKLGRKGRTTTGLLASQPCRVQTGLKTRTMLAEPIKKTADPEIVSYEPATGVELWRGKTSNID